MTSKGSERRIGDKNLFDKGLGDRSGQEKLLPELGTNSDRKGRSGAEGPDGIPLDLSQPKDPSFDDDTDSRKRVIASCPRPCFWRLMTVGVAAS